MKKLLTTTLAFASVFASFMALTSCGSTEKEVALITDVGDIDDESFNQTAWEGVKEYATENKLTYNYYKPTEDSKEARVASIKQSIQKGAKVVVCPGYLFETALFEVQSQYPDTKFILLDGEPHSDDYKTYKTEANCTNFLYKEEVSGYLAGYAAVKDGYTKLGFCGGMAVPAVQRFGSGYLQGISAASDAMNVSTSVKYYYAGAFAATDEATASMKTWYKGDTEAVFACGGKVYQSVVEGAKEKSTSKWIGVDVDQNSVDPSKVLTSATKGLKESVKTALSLYKSNKFDDIGGKTSTLGLNSSIGSAEAKDYVGLPTAHWNFKTFKQEDYNTLVTSIKGGSLEISNDITKAPTLSNKVTVDYVSAFANAE